ncbi:hypothetical protein [Streptomyces sp. NPDC029721]|uniref:hypothetical protein n=1 Tax=Streptomyces sp. NPDC029721 TaxID=3157090 RepID=UPI0033C7E1BB
MTDDESTDIGSLRIDAYLAYIQGDGVDTDDLAWNLVTALRSADERRAAGA